MTELMLPEVTAIDIIEQLNAYLADMARQNLDLREENSRLEKRYARLLRLFNENDKVSDERKRIA